MNTAKRFKEYFKSIHLITSDYFLAFGFIFFIPFAAFSWIFMVTANPSNVPIISIQMIITCFVLCSICWIVYFFLEAKAGSVKNDVFTWLFVLYLVMSVVSVLVQPTDSLFLVECRNVNYFNRAMYPGIEVGDIITVNHHISIIHRLFFAMASALITTIFFIIFFVLPKRITSTYFLVIICTIVAAFNFVVTMYSYIVEGDQYAPFIRALFRGDANYISKSFIHSFVVHNVPYGATMLMGLLFMFIAHHLTHKKFWLLIGVYCYINLIFSWCKSCLLLSTLSILFYVVFLLVKSFKQHMKRNIILSIIFGAFLIANTAIMAVSIATKGKLIYQIYNLSLTFTKSKTLLMRTYIWGNIRNELKGGWWIIGRGFGTHNAMLYPMNLVNGDDVCPSHSTYYGILGAGGIINLLGFIGMFIYFMYAFIKCLKVDKVKAIGLGFPVFIYLLYSFTECINYFWLAFMFPIILYYNLIKKYVLK